MSNPIRFVKNLAYDVGISSNMASAPAAETAMPADNLLNRDRYRVCRITPTSNTAVITATLNSTQTVGAVGIFGILLAEAATAKCRLLAGDGSPLWDSTTVPLFPSSAGYSLGQYNRGFVFWCNQNYTGVKAIELTLNDATSSYYEISRIAFGTVWSPTDNPTYDSLSWGWRNTSEYYRTSGGTGRAVTTDAYRAARYHFQFLDSSERNAMGLYLQGAGESLMVSLFPELGGQVEADHQMLCEIVDQADLVPMSAKVWETTLALEEI